MQNWIPILRAVLGLRDGPSHQNLRLPGYAVSAGLVVLGFAAYLVGGAGVERELRVTFLVAFGCALLIFVCHLGHEALARWMVIPALTGFVFWLAWNWQEAGLLHLLVIPVVLAAVMVSLPAALLTALLHSLLVPAAQGYAAFILAPDAQWIVLFSVWLAALAAGGGQWMVERFAAQAGAESQHLQKLLVESRDQQARLAQALDDLGHANRQLSLLYEKNISLRKVAEEATEAKTTYIARVSHEIRTPLNMILGLTESIIENQEVYEEELPLDLVDDIKIIRRNSEHLLSLVNDVLDLTRAESSQLILKKDWIDLAEEIEKSVEIVQPLARKKRLDLHFEQAQALPPIFGDRTRLRQVILNLLSNAVRYTDQGGVTVRAAADDTWLTISVIDTGPGIEAEDAERIFEPFYRGSNSSRQETTGTGLGLSVSRQLVDLHGGKVWLESQPGQGSAFFFRLPLMRGEGLTRSPARFVSEQWAWVERDRRRNAALTPPRRKRVVVCSPDDLLWNRLETSAEEVEFVRLDGLDQLSAEIERTPAHLILINAATPDELMAQLQQAAGQVKDTPLMGSAFLPRSEQLQRTGAAEYLQKPFSNQLLRETVARIAPDARRILIADDNTDVQKLAARVLGMDNEQLQFLLAATGRDALDVANRKQPDLVLLDLALPDMTGWEVLAKLKRTPSLYKVPVIIISAHDLSDTPPRSDLLVLTHGEGISLEQYLQYAMRGMGE